MFQVYNKVIQLHTHTHTHTYILLIIFHYRLLCVSLATQSCLILCDPMDCGLPGSSVLGISQARILEWVAISHSKKSSRPRDGTHFSYTSFIGRQILYHCATWETHIGYYKILNIVPCAIQWVLILYFVYSSVSLFISIS